MTSQPMTKAERAAIIQRIAVTLATRGLYVVNAADKAILQAAHDFYDVRFAARRADCARSRLIAAVDAGRAALEREVKP